jgi:hypothetical protein
MPTYSTSTKYALRRLLGSNIINDIDAGIAALADDVDSNMAGYAEGTLAGRPAAGKAGRNYRCTDTGQWFADTGTVWVETARLATALGDYRTVSEARFGFNPGATANTYVTTEQGTATFVGNSTSVPFSVIPINLADYAVAGLTTQFRVQASTMTNPTAPAVNFTYALAPITALTGSAGTLGISTIGALLGSVTRSAPSNGSAFQDTGADFTIASSVTHVLVVVLSGTTVAASLVQSTVRLQVHNI